MQATITLINVKPTHLGDNPCEPRDMFVSYEPNYNAHVAADLIGKIIDDVQFAESCAREAEEDGLTYFADVFRAEKWYLTVMDLETGNIVYNHVFKVTDYN